MNCFPKFAMAMVLVLFVWPFNSNAYGRMQIFDQNELNPNIRCPGKNEEIQLWRPCPHGGYIENPDPLNCADRYICYVGLNELCNPGDKCADNGICTMCGLCQKCESPEKCSEFQLCSNSQMFPYPFKRGGVSNGLLEYIKH